MTPEFDLIQRYFTRPTRHTSLGVGDDAAILSVAQGQELLVSADTSVVDTHFFVDCPPYAIGWKSLAVNVSDMAAMGGEPMWATLALTLPSIHHDWLAEFSRGFFACADAFQVDLIGGDTTRGPLNISITILGQVPAHQAMRRSGAQTGDDVWVSGRLGSAALGLAHLQQRLCLPETLVSVCLAALHTPQPRVALGLALRGIASSCIDISDGLLADLQHLLTSSDAGARVVLEDIPCEPFVQSQWHLPTVQAAVLAGGDDYELCFTAPPQHRAAIFALGNALSLPLTRLGVVTHTGKLEVFYQGQPLQPTAQGYDHFG